MRSVLVSLAALAVIATAPLPAAAAGGTPVTPVRLLNGTGTACATDAAAPLYYNPAGGFTVEAVASDTDPGETVLTEQFQVWPTSDPTDVSTWSLSVGAGTEGILNVPGSTFTDGQTYAWQAATVADGTTSAWSAPCYVAVDETRPANAPTVTSVNYPQGVRDQPGAPIQVTFGSNGDSDVMGYVFSWVGSMPIPVFTTLSDPFTGPAGTVRASSLGGSATLNLIPPPGSSGFLRLTVASFDRAYNGSPVTTYDIDLKLSAPSVTVCGLPNFGTPTTFTLHPDAALQAQSPVTSYDITVVGSDAGQQSYTVPAAADGTASARITIDSSFGEWLYVTSVSADGWNSDADTYLVNPAPTVSSDVYAENGSSGGVGVTGTFTFKPPFHDVVAYGYSFDYGTTVTTVNAHDGKARIHWTPTASGQYDIEVYAILKDGTQLFPYDYFFTVG